MLTVENKTYRNLQEQVYKNAQDILNFKYGEGVLNQFGIKVIDQVNSIADLPTVQNYIQSQEALGRELDELYGDAIAVGATTPYTLYIFTRAFSGIEEPEWFSIGQFPVAGPQGQQGVQGPVGPQGDRGSTWTILPNNPTTTSGYQNGDSFLNSATGDVYFFNGNSWIRQGNIRGQQGIQGVQGIQGPTGPQGPVGLTGPAGPAGQSFQVAGILSNTNQLPTPTESIRNQAYLVGDETDGFDMFIITGSGSNLLWFNAGSVTSIEGPQGPQGIQGIQGQPGKDGKDGDTITNIQAGNVSYQESQTITPITISLSSGEVYTLNVVAQRGPQGLQGIQGIRGPEGPKGATGPKGPQGPQGPAGEVDYSNIYTKQQVEMRDESLQTTLNNRITSETRTLGAQIDEVSSTLSNNYYDKDEVNSLVAGLGQLNIKVVSVLPETGQDKTIYFLRVEGSTANHYDEYMFINGQWELVGSTGVDLDNYYNKSQVDALIIGKADQSDVDSLNDDVEELTQNQAYHITITKNNQEVLWTAEEVANYGYGDKIIHVHNPNGLPWMIRGNGLNEYGTMNDFAYPTQTDETTTSLTLPKESIILLRASVNDDDVTYWYPTVIGGGGTIDTFGRDANGYDTWSSYDTKEVLSYDFRPDKKQKTLHLTNFKSFPTYSYDEASSTAAFDFNLQRTTGILMKGPGALTYAPLHGPSELVQSSYVRGFSLINLSYNTYSDYENPAQMLFVDGAIYYRFDAGAWTKIGTTNGESGGSGSSITLIDSDTIKVNTTASGTQLVLATDVANNITRSLKAPVSNVSQLELVGIAPNSTEQTMRAIGGSNTIQVSDDGKKLTFDIKAGTVGSWQPEIANVELLPIFANQLGGLCGAVEDTIVLKTGATIDIDKSSNNDLVDNTQILGLTYLYDQYNLITSISNLKCSMPCGMSVQFTTGASCTNNETQTKFKGDDCSNGVFTPQANTVYEVFIWGQQREQRGATYYSGVVMNKGTV